MTSARDQQIWALYRSALERPPSERASLIADFAGGDDELRKSVEQLLLQHDATSVGASASRVTAQEAADLPIGSLLGHYRIDGVIGRGGMGVVYRATDTRLGRSVAIKFLSVSVADAEASRRFRQEAKTASSLNHPHIITVHDVGEHDARQYIVSELVDGGTLEDWAAVQKRTWRRSVELLTGVADGLAAAHTAGVLHRDVKPGNILIGGNGYAKLADFGLAKLIDSSARDPAGRSGVGTTRAGVVVGTVAYMSPEQSSGQPLDARSDIFSFGIVLYELLAGRRPFDAANDLGVLKAIAHAAPVPLPADVPEFLRIAVDKALEKDPADRYQSMRDLVVDLRRVARQPTSSQAVSASDVHVAAGLIRRHPGAVFGAALALVLAVVGATYLVVAGLVQPAPSAAVAGAASRDYEIVQLTTSGNAVTPAISPDGTFVAYAQSPEAGDDPTSLWIRQVATPSNVEIVTEEPGIVVVAPTVQPGSAFVHFLRADRGNLALSLWRVPFLGGPQRRLKEDAVGPVGWSPDGTRMAFVRRDRAGGAASLVVADADGGGERELLSRQPPMMLLSLTFVGNPAVRPAWSPDGRVIALYEVDVSSFEGRVVFVDVATSEETARVVPGAVGAHGLAWLDSSTLVLSQPRTLQQRVQLWRLSYPDGAVVPLTNDLSSYIGVDVDRERTRLVTSRRDTRLAVWVGAIGDEGAEIVAPTPFVGELPQVRWVGERLLYDRMIGGERLIGAVRPDGALEEFVPNASWPSATSSADTVVFMRADLGLSGGLWKVDASSRQPIQLVEDGFTAVVTPDDRNVVFLSTRAGDQSPWIVPIEGGEPVQIIDRFAATGSVDVSPDGQLLFVSTGTSGEAEFFMCDLPSCPTLRSARRPANMGDFSPRWSADGREITYVDDRGTNIWTTPLDGGEPSSITHFVHTPGTRISGFAWSRDGRLAILRTTTTNDIVLLRFRP